MDLKNGKHEDAADNSESGKCETEHIVETCSNNDDEGEDTNKTESANCEKTNFGLNEVNYLLMT